MTRTGNGGLTVRRPVANPAPRSVWSEFDEMNRQMDALFGNVLGFAPVARFIPAMPGASYVNHEFTPDIYEADDELVYVLPLPGIDAEALQVEATADTLTIRGERKPCYQNEKARQLRQGWWSAGQGSFEMRFSLPLEVQAENVQAHYRNGILELHLPKAEAIKPKSIKVNVASQPETITPAENN
jgi:HSP20 family protein